MSKVFVYQMKRQDKIDALCPAVMGLGDVPAYYMPWLVDWRDAVEVPGWRWSLCATEADAIHLARLRLGSQGPIHSVDVAHPHRGACTALLWACAGPQACDYVGNDPGLLFEAMEGWMVILAANYTKYTQRLCERQRGSVGLDADLDSFSWGVYGPAVHAMVGARMLFRWSQTPHGQAWSRGSGTSPTDVRVAHGLIEVLRPMLALWAYLSVPANSGGRAVLMSEDASEAVSRRGWDTVAPYLDKVGFAIIALSLHLGIYINSRPVHRQPHVYIPRYYSEKDVWVRYLMATYRLMRILEPWLAGLKTSDQTTLDDPIEPNTITVYL